MSDAEPAEIEEPAAEPEADQSAPEPVQNRASRRAKAVKQAKPSHVGPRQDKRGKR